MKRVCVAVFFFIYVSPFARLEAQTETEDMKLERHFRQYLDAEFKLHPLHATRAGNHDFDDKLDDVSPKAREASLDRARKTHAELSKKIDYAMLTRSAQIDFEIWQ